MQKVRFEDILYIRPDYKQYARNIELCAQGIRNADTMETVRHKLEEFWDYRTNVETMETLAFIRCYQDCTDVFYQEEMQITQSQGVMSDLSPIYDALLESPLRQKIDTAYGGQFLLKIEKGRSLVQSGLELLGREQELIAQFQNKISAVKFQYEGQEVSSAELSKYRESRDVSTRKKAREASRKVFAERSDEFLQLLGELVEVRGQIAQANGCVNYLEYANKEKGRYSYGEAELTQLCQMVRRELVPLKQRLYERLRSRLDVSVYTADDTGIYFEEGNPEPVGDAMFLLEQAAKMYRQMDGDFAALFEAMRDGGYIDCQKSANKITGMGFCTEIFAEKLPFIFGNCIGKHTDVNILVHEFGHALQMKQSMEQFSVPEYWEMPNDLSEIPSKAMEQLSYEYAPLFFGERAPQFIETHLITILEEICGYCMIHEFETFLYTEKFDARKAVAEYNRLSEIYDAGIDYSGCRAYLDKGAPLVQNKGIYMFPRYLISYAMSDISAISIRLKYEADKEKGLSVYKKLCGLGGSKEYDGAMEALGLPLPYSEQAVRDAKDYLENKLGLEK